MTDVVIRAEGLGKRYRIGGSPFRRFRYRAVRDVIGERVRASLRALTDRGSSPEDAQMLWALRDVSFEVTRGDVVGIIGRNGAGKSTLLKILSRITEPTTGQAMIAGRVGTLLEVGTGFHPELTGRENVYLSGAILGMRKREIDARFDEIVQFAEVEAFLDTPVKRYSSGMYLRLAFAVAAHLEPDILLVDEVLSVGDIRFQQKCLGKIGDVVRQGRTVLFVSHDMSTITKLCPRGILLDRGRIEMAGEMRAVVARYLSEGVDQSGFADLRTRGDRSGSGEARFLSVELLQGTARCTTVPFGSALTIRCLLDVRTDLGPAPVEVEIRTTDGIRVHDLWNWNDDCAWSGEPGLHQFVVVIPEVHLYPDTYWIDLWIGDQTSNRVDYLTSAISFQVVQTPESPVQMTLRRSNGLVFQHSRWTHEALRLEGAGSGSTGRA